MTNEPLLTIIAAAHFQTSTVVAASIGAIGVIGAAIIGTWPARRATSYQQFLQDLGERFQASAQDLAKQLEQAAVEDIRRAIREELHHLNRRRP